MNTWSCDEETAKRCVGFGISLFLGLVNENADKVLDEALKLSIDDADTATTCGLAVLFEHHGLVAGEKLRGGAGKLEGLKDRLLYPGGVESEEDE